MSLMAGACSSLFHVAYRNPILVAVLGVAGFSGMLSSSPEPGDTPGAKGILNARTGQILKQHPELAMKLVDIKGDFERSYPTIKDDEIETEVKRVLSVTDACTDINVRDVMANPERRKEAAWVYYLDSLYERDHPDRRQVSVATPYPRR